MYKNQLQELAQRSCFSLPSYVCTREGPDHAPRFKATVTFNGETFHGPTCCTTLRQAEHAAAEVALARLSTRGPSTYLTARVLDETGVYKNLLQETAHRAGLKLPAYTTVRSGPGHSPVFASSVELAGLSFAGDAARTKKQAEKNAAMTAWSALKQMPEARKEPGNGCVGEEQEHVVVARVLAALKQRCDVNAASPLPKQHCLAGSSSSSAPNPSLYRHQWLPLSSHAAQPRTRHVQPQPAGPRILPPLHMLQRPAPSTSRHGGELERQRRIDAAELVQMLERAMVTNREEAMPSAPCYYPHVPAYHHAGAAPRYFAAGGFHSPAMAVSVRSVIPMCSAPPSRPQPAAATKDDHDDDRNDPAAPAEH
ncbi:double-stranded RNA-binding protein 3-like [Triticum dicoccoides]|uniref:double-stranded RNA-binding protein 3-like n=1 Tax=Triticum dicoccoides TaxID=85692 RepID=UPI000E79D16D|nr:double-stranded RNA-binding protein 3-like [Triticum dicoccoides]